MGKLRDKIERYAVGTLLVASLVSTIVAISSKKIYETYYGTYQGHRTLKDDGRPRFRFNDETNEKIGSKTPEKRVFGNYSLTDTLKIGKKYLLTTKRGPLSTSDEYIKVILPGRFKHPRNK